jgi:hypothetical protein
MRRAGGGGGDVPADAAALHAGARPEDAVQAQAAALHTGTCRGMQGHAAMSLDGPMQTRSISISGADRGSRYRRTCTPTCRRAAPAFALRLRALACLCRARVCSPAAPCWRMRAWRVGTPAALPARLLTAPACRLLGHYRTPAALPARRCRALSRLVPPAAAPCHACFLCLLGLRVASLAITSLRL